MATMTLTLHEGQTWVYPAITYTSLKEGVYKKKNHWYKNHSVPSKRGVYCYQGGTAQDDGKYNGNMLSIMLFKDSSGRSLKNFVKAIGGSGKITKITLKMYVHHGWGGYFTPRICMTPYWDTSSLTGRTGDSYSAVGFKHILTTGSLKKPAWHNIDLTAYKSDFDTYESIGFYCPGAYNVSNSSYGCIHSHGGTYKPTLTIEYTTNSAPYQPNTVLTNTKDGHGYSVPNLTFRVDSNGDPDNNLHSSPYGYTIYDQYWNWITESGWVSHNNFSFDASNYRGQTIKVRGWVRDAEGLTNYKDINAYINSRPYWNGINSEQVKINLDAGVTNGVFKDSVTISWAKATDAQSQHSGNLRYSVYMQKGTDKGPNGDTSANCVVSSITDTKCTIRPSDWGVAKGERVYFSVWVSDGLEWSSYRLTSQWLYREQPPSAVSNVSPTSGHYENGVTVSWSAASGSNGTWISHYTVNLLNSSGGVVKSYTTTNTSLTCSDLGSIGRGQNFKFQVYSTDNLGNTSTSAYSGNLKRNSAPTKPLSFRVDSNKLFFKNSIPLTWGASSDADGDTVKYDVYYNVNGGAYQSLTLGTTSTKTNHNISGFNAGTKFNYYVQAYDTFGVYSDKTYISAQPQVNTPPGTPSIALPIADRTLYTNQPRIVFNVSTVTDGGDVTVYISLNGTWYNSKDNSDMFNKSAYSPNSTGVFIVPSNTPLNYSNKNTVKIKVFDGMDYSSEKSYNFIVDSTLVNKIGSSEDRLIKVSNLEDVRAMVNATRFAYGLNETTWHGGADVGTAIYKKYYEQISNSIHEVNTLLNGKSTLKRTYTKDSFVTGELIKKTMFNNLIDIILKP